MSIFRPTDCKGTWTIYPNIPHCPRFEHHDHALFIATKVTFKITDSKNPATKVNIKYKVPDPQDEDKFIEKEEELCSFDGKSQNAVQKIERIIYDFSDPYLSVEGTCIVYIDGRYLDEDTDVIDGGCKHNHDGFLDDREGFCRIAYDLFKDAIDDKDFQSYHEARHSMTDDERFAFFWQTIQDQGTRHPELRKLYGGWYVDPDRENIFWVNLKRMRSEVGVKTVDPYLT